MKEKEILKKFILILIMKKLMKSCRFFLFKFLKENLTNRKDIVLIKLSLGGLSLGLNFG